MRNGESAVRNMTEISGRTQPVKNDDFLFVNIKHSSVFSFLRARALFTKNGCISTEEVGHAFFQYHACDSSEYC